MAKGGVPHPPVVQTRREMRRAMRRARTQDADGDAPPAFEDALAAEEYEALRTRVKYARGALVLAYILQVVMTLTISNDVTRWTGVDLFADLLCPLPLVTATIFFMPLTETPFLDTYMVLQIAAALRWVVLVYTCYITHRASLLYEATGCPGTAYAPIYFGGYYDEPTDDECGFWKAKRKRSATGGDTYEYRFCCSDRADVREMMIAYDNKDGPGRNVRALRRLPTYGLRFGARWGRVAVWLVVWLLAVRIAWAAVFSDAVRDEICPEQCHTLPGSEDYCWRDACEMSVNMFLAEIASPLGGWGYLLITEDNRAQLYREEGTFYNRRVIVEAVVWMVVWILVFLWAVAKACGCTCKRTVSKDADKEIGDDPPPYSDTSSLDDSPSDELTETTSSASDTSDDAKTREKKQRRVARTAGARRLQKVQSPGQAMVNRTIV